MTTLLAVVKVVGVNILKATLGMRTYTELSMVMVMINFATHKKLIIILKNLLGHP
jgi:hypothetical protein